MMGRFIRYVIMILTGLFSGASAQSCKPPFSFKFEDFTTTSVILKWSDLNISPSGWELELVERGKQPTGIPNYGPLNQKEVLFTSLRPSTAYEVYIRTVCTPDNKSNWNVAIPFSTVLEIPTACLTSLPLKDNGTETFLLDIPEKGILGKDVFLRSVDLIVGHDWPADLKITLVSPQGQQLVLSSHNGTVYDDFGLPGDTTCRMVTSFAPGACRQLKESSPPYLGEFRPDGNPDAWRPDTLSRGYWKLIFFDRAIKDVGNLRYVNMTFSSEKCLTPEAFVLAESDSDLLTFSWAVPSPACNTVRLELTDPLGNIQTVFVECNEKSYTFNGLEPNTQYSCSISGICSDFSQSPLSCSVVANTTCEAVTMAESFDDYNLCTESCNATCITDGSRWYNDHTDGSTDWIIWTGSTDTENTGPSGDISGEGKYIYLENNPTICGSGSKACLLSECIEVVHNPSGCDMSFYSHMFGPDITTLYLEISTDGGISWDTLTNTIGNQGDRWQRKTLSLGNYHGRMAVFRFSAETSDGVLGDIAIDQIEFYGSLPAAKPSIFYRDVDNDGYGTTTDSVSVCRTTPLEGFSPLNGDCDDTNASIYPGAQEIQCNAIDENCNGNEDDKPETNPLKYTHETGNASCNGLADGFIRLNISGGNPPYDVKWTNQLNGSQIFGLSPGIYQAEITDFGGCKLKTEFFELVSLSYLSIIVEQKTQPSCTGKADGAIFISHSGNSSPYTYLWSNGSNNKDLQTVPEGKYTVTITDNRNCTAVMADIPLTSKPKVTTGILSLKKPLCFGQNTGEAELISFGGQSPYTYSWQSGQTAAKISMVPAGRYICTITDASGCMNHFELNIESPPPLTGKVLSTEDVRCYGERNGSIKTTISGGFPPYTYLWNNFSTSDDIFNLKAGTYTLTATDNNGCHITVQSVKINEPQEMVLMTDTLIPATCPSGRDGKVALTASGGNGGYQYSWSHTVTSSSQLDSLVSGNYSVTAFDKLGCKASIPNIFVPFINDDPGVTLTLVHDKKCYKQNDAVISASIQKGKPDFDYNWSHGVQYFNPQKTDTLFSLAAGTYRLTVTDQAGCTGVSNEIKITEKTPYFYTVSMVGNNNCNTDSTGQISIEISGNAGHTKVQWNEGTYSGPIITGLPNGQYSGTIIDSLGCTLEIVPVNITSLSDIEVRAQIVPDTNFTSAGSFCVSFVGGIPPYTFSVDGVITEGSCLQQLPSGEYKVKVTDGSGCIAETTLTIENISGTENETLHGYRLYPNPAGEEGITMEWATSPDRLQLVSVSGIMILEMENLRQTKRLSLPLEGIPSGCYVVRLISADSVKSLIFFIR